jgi:uncharacterized protein YndB with AHSA1/START domain
MNPDIRPPLRSGVAFETDWQSGALWRMVFPDGRTANSGEILEIDPPHRPVLTWRNDHRPERFAEGYSRAELESGKGATKATNFPRLMAEFCRQDRVLLPPKGHGRGDERDSSRGKGDAPGAAITAIGAQRHQSTCLQLSDRRRHGGVVHHKEAGEFAELRPAHAAHRDHHRELPVGEAQVREQAVEAAGKFARRPLRCEAEALIAHLQGYRLRKRHCRSHDVLISTYMGCGKDGFRNALIDKRKSAGLMVT